MKILVVGTSGSGKTTTATSLAQRLAIPHVELDALFWGPDWTQPDRAEFRDRVLHLLDDREQWVVDGNYRSVRDDIASRADLLIWLDYPLVRTQWRLFRRTTTRLVSREPLWNGNRESARMLFASRFELFRWARKEHQRLRREIPELCSAGPAGSCVRIRDTRDLQRLFTHLDGLESPLRQTRHQEYPPNPSGGNIVD